LQDRQLKKTRNGFSFIDPHVKVAAPRGTSLVHSLQVQPTETSRWNSALYLVTSRQLLVSARQNDRLLRSVSVQRPHYRNPRQHFRPVAFGNQQQRLWPHITSSWPVRARRAFGHELTGSALSASFVRTGAYLGGMSGTTCATNMPAMLATF
jgi:hypothetical protein